MKSFRDAESVGWVFWLALCLVLVGPCMYLSWRFTYSGTAATSVRLGFGVVLALVGAGFLTWPINVVLHRRAERRYNAQRKTERKRKRKRKKKRK